MQILSSQEEMQEAFLDLKKKRHRPWVYASAAMTLNGKIRGKRSPFSGLADRDWYSYLLSQAETVVLGANTFRESGKSEKTNYQNKQIVVFSNSLDLPLEAPVIRGRDSFIVYTQNKDLKKHEALLEAGTNIEIREMNEETGAKEIIASLGGQRILIDGGGYIYTFFAEMIEDWYLTLIPRFSESSRPGLWVGEGESADLIPQTVFISEQEGQERIFLRFSKSALAVDDRIAKKI